MPEMLRCFLCGKETERFRGWSFCGNGAVCPGTDKERYKNDYDAFHTWRPVQETEKEVSDQ